MSPALPYESEFRIAGIRRQFCSVSCTCAAELRGQKVEMKLAIIDPGCDKKEFQRSPGRRTLLDILLGDGSFEIDYYASEDLTALVSHLGFPESSYVAKRYASTFGFHPLGSKSLFLRKWDNLAHRIFHWNLALERRVQLAGWRMLVAQTASKLRRFQSRYDAIIAVNDFGLVASESRNDCPLVYYSLEVYDEENTHIRWDEWRKGFKERERVRFRGVDILIIQDEGRAKLMFEDMRRPFDRGKYVQLPVTYPGKSRKERNDYLRAQFPDLRDKTILLQQSVGWPHRSEEIATMAVQNPNDDFAIVFNGAIFPDRPGRYVQHKPFLSCDEFDILISSADIGLIFYLAESDNDLLISHASGQLSHFAMLGVPVITSNTPSLEHLVKKYNSGIVVNSANEIYAAATQIVRDYARYCAGALACFDAEYDIANYRYQIVHRIKSLRIPS